jgi:hypothetical protein
MSRIPYALGFACVARVLTRAPGLNTESRTPESTEGLREPYHPRTCGSAAVGGSNPVRRPMGPPSQAPLPPGSTLPPVATIRSAPSRRDRCSALASSQGARIQTSCSSGVVRIIGIAFGCPARAAGYRSGRAPDRPGRAAGSRRGCGHRVEIAHDRSAGRNRLVPLTKRALSQKAGLQKWRSSRGGTHGA